MAADRTILHCDLNAFFAAVECLFRPELNDGPMAVCGDPDTRHGIILAKNEKAKRYGVKTAETIWQAKQKCPGLVLVTPHHDEYVRYSRLVYHIYEQYTDQVEPFGLDEAWLDVTGSLHLFGSGRDIADTLRRRVHEELGLTISVGVSFNKVFAKLGSDYKKPDATTVITRDNYRQIVHPLPASALLFVGRSVEDTLAKMGILTIGDLAGSDKRWLTDKLGKAGAILHKYANGEDESPVGTLRDERPIKSVGNGITFKKDLTTWEEIQLGVYVLCDKVASRMRAHGVKCGTVQVKLRSPDFRDSIRQRKLSHSTHLAQEIAEMALLIVGDMWKVGMRIRMMTITASGIVREQEDVEQLGWFEGEAIARRDKQERLEVTVDAIRRKFGRFSIQPAAILHNELGIREAQDRDGQEEE